MRQEKLAELLTNIETVEKPQLLPFVEIHNSKINHLQAPKLCFWGFRQSRCAPTMWTVHFGINGWLFVEQVDGLRRIGNS